MSSRHLSNDVIKVVLIMWTIDVSYTFNVWINDRICGSLTYDVGKGLYPWAQDTVMKALIQTQHNRDLLEDMMEEEITKRAVEEVLLS